MKLLIAVGGERKMFIFLMFIEITIEASTIDWLEMLEEYQPIAVAHASLFPQMVLGKICYCYAPKWLDILTGQHTS